MMFVGASFQLQCAWGRGAARTSIHGVCVCAPCVLMRRRAAAGSADTGGRKAGEVEQASGAAVTFGFGRGADAMGRQADVILVGGARCRSCGRADDSRGWSVVCRSGVWGLGVRCVDSSDRPAHARRVGAGCVAGLAGLEPRARHGCRIAVRCWPGCCHDVGFRDRKSVV